MKRSLHPRGFTLVEVLIALALLSLILLGLTGALRTFADSAARIETRAWRSDDVRLVSALLREALGNAAAINILLPGNQAVVKAFSGGEDQIEWVGVLPARHGLGGLHHLRLQIGQDRSLQLTMAPLMGENRPADWQLGRSRALVYELDQFSLRYQGAGQQVWLPAWTDTTVLPARVSVQIAASGEIWPPLIVSLLAAERSLDPNLVVR